MAVTSVGNVYKVTANGDTLPGIVSIVAVKYVPGTGTPTASIAGNNEAGSGITVWSTASTAELCDRIQARCPEGVTVSMAGTGTVVYIYTGVVER